MVAQVLAIAGKRVLQRRIGERALLTFLTARLAMAPKCRTACDLLVWLPPLPDTVVPSASPAFEARCLAEDLLELQRTAALWKSVASLSIRTRTGWRSVSKGDAGQRDNWLTATGVPPLVRYVVQRGGSTEGLNVLLVPAYQLAQCGARGFSAPAPATTSSEEIGHVPAYAHCIFSEPGRAALRRFLALSETWRNRCAELGVHDPMRAVGHLVFHVEGGYCADVLSVARAAEIKTLSEVASLARFGVPEDHVRNLQQEMALDLASLNAVRRAIAVRYA